MSQEPRWLEGADQRIRELRDSIESIEASIHELEASKAEFEDELGKVLEFVDVMKEMDVSEEIEIPVEVPLSSDTLREQIVTVLKRNKTELSGHDLSQMLNKDRRQVGTVLTALEQEDLIHEVRQEKVKGPYPRRYFMLVEGAIS